MPSIVWDSHGFVCDDDTGDFIYKTEILLQASSPACTELETITLNWLGKMIGLPDDFLHMGGNGQGGGVIQTTASEATLVCLLAGRTQAIRRFHEKTPGLQDSEINARLVAYCSDQAHSSVEKAALIGKRTSTIRIIGVIYYFIQGLVRMRFIESDEDLSMRGDALDDAICDDIKLGLVPFWVSFLRKKSESKNSSKRTAPCVLAQTYCEPQVK